MKTVRSCSLPFYFSRPRLASSLSSTLLFLLCACSENPTVPPDGSILGRLRLDPHTGIYKDTTAHPDSTQWPAFADIPESYRQFFFYCTPCHSNAHSTEDRRRELNLNNWEQIKAYGPARLILIAQTHAMPKSGGPVPEDVLAKVQTWLALGMPPDSIDSNAPVDSAIKGTAFEPARAFATKYCAHCHTAGGKHPDKPLAYGYGVKLDTYENWSKRQKVVLDRLDKARAQSLDIDPMPQANSTQPTKEEREMMINWILRGSPNTENGQ